MRRRNRGGADVDAARRLLQEFHSRSDSGVIEEAPWSPPPELWAVGVGEQVLYSSDKVDPGDPSDPGGVWKGYFHDQNPDTLVYLPPGQAKKLLRGKSALDRIYPEWPEVVTWLGSADGYTVSINGQTKTVRLDGKKGSGLQLWAMPSLKGAAGSWSLLAAPAAGGRESDCVVWCGPALTVSWPGIEG